MTTLEEAWAWYQATAESLWRIERIARRYWDEPNVRELLGKDDGLRELDKGGIEKEARQAREHLDDLAVLVLFSVFETVVRGLVRDQVAGEVAGLQHPALKHAGRETLRAIEDNSFFRVLEPYKNLDSNLIEEVNQVRHYRNWVAHGRRGDPANAVDPKSAYDRLSRFLQLLIPVPPTEPPTPESS